MNVFKKISISLSKNMYFFNLMSRKESKFYVINFIDPRMKFKKKILTTLAMKTRIQISYKECELE